jgi:uncharacterized protein (UPF0332 family)
MRQVGLNEDAGREVYLACFHAARALIFERTDKVAKTHRGVQTEFYQLTKGDDRLDAELRRFLSRAYQFKSVADYEIGPLAAMTDAQVSESIAVARRFIETVTDLVTASQSDTKQA